MKKTIFTLIAVTTIFIFASCNNTDDENSNQTETIDTSSSELASSITGQQIGIEGTSYYVISNQLSDENQSLDMFTARNADATRKAVSSGNRNTDILIEKFASDGYVRKFLKEIGIKNYVQVMQTNLEDSISISGAKDGSQDSNIVDTFYFVDKNLHIIATFKQDFKSDMLIANLVERQIEGFETIDKRNHAEMKNAFLEKFAFASDGITRDYSKLAALHQNYQPSVFEVTTTPEKYNGDLKTRINIQKKYNYDENGEVALTKKNMKESTINKDYKMVIDASNTSKMKNSYRYTYNDDDNKKYRFGLKGENVFYDFINKENTNGYRQLEIASRGTAPFGDNSVQNVDNNQEHYQQQIKFTFNTSGDAFKIEITTKLLNTIDSKKTITIKTFTNETPITEQIVIVSGINELDGNDISLAQAIAKLSNNIRFSKETKILNGYTVPSKIYVRATYPDSFTDCEFLKDLDIFDVTLVPDESKTTGVYYKEIKRTKEDDEENIPSFVQKYSDVFDKVFNRTYNTKSTVFTEE